MMHRLSVDAMGRVRVRTASGFVRNRFLHKFLLIFPGAAVNVLVF